MMGQAACSGLSTFRCIVARVRANPSDPIKEGVNALLVLFGGKDVGGDAVGTLGRLVPGGAVGEGHGDFSLVAVGAGPSHLA